MGTVTKEMCPYCDGTKVNVDITDEHLTKPCPQCNGSGINLRGE